MIKVICPKCGEENSGAVLENCIQCGESLSGVAHVEVKTDAKVLNFGSSSSHTPSSSYSSGNYAALRDIASLCTGLGWLIVGLRDLFGVWLLGVGGFPQVPSSHEFRYLNCSSVSKSIFTPMASSLKRAISRSISAGTS